MLPCICRLSKLAGCCTKEWMMCLRQRDLVANGTEQTVTISYYLAHRRRFTYRFFHSTVTFRFGSRQLQMDTFRFSPCGGGWHEHLICKSCMANDCHVFVFLTTIFIGLWAHSNSIFTRLFQWRVKFLQVASMLNGSQWCSSDAFQSIIVHFCYAVNNIRPVIWQTASSTFSVCSSFIKNEDLVPDVEDFFTFMFFS